MTDSDEPQISLPVGFRFAGVACGIKESGKPDVSLIVTDRPVVAAAVYTKNQIVAAPVVLSAARTPSKSVRAIVADSGNANACTGDLGHQNAVAMCQQVAAEVGCDESAVLVMSTGVIGQQLPMPLVSQGITSAHGLLASSAESFFAAAEAIRTTDKDRKTSFREIQIGDQTYRIAAMAKGAGMIAPNMATMLAVVMTDAPIAPDAAQTLLADAADLSFNRVSVDGHTSTNDTMLLLASGEEEPLDGDSLQKFASELNALSIELAKQLVADGEGATHVMQVLIHGAANTQAAETVARTVGASPLVKTAITGGDPNWGRIVSAAGYAEAEILPERTTLKICGVTIYENGTPQDFDAAVLSAQMKAAAEVDIDLQVGDGSGDATLWFSDLTTDYVQFNSEYTT